MLLVGRSVCLIILSFRSLTCRAQIQAVRGSVVGLPAALGAATTTLLLVVASRATSTTVGLTTT